MPYRQKPQTSPPFAEAPREPVPRDGVSLRIPPGGRLRIESPTTTLELQAEPRPSWADQQGRDRDGLFATLPWRDGQAVARWQPGPPGGDGSWRIKLPFGFDEYGLYVDVRIAGVSQRFRWIPPGSFRMGSPEEEPERASDETPHEVTLSQGYWLADTPVTQALYQAVTGRNPSRFKERLGNPVERVSWEEVTAFIERLNQTLPGLRAGLPSEAQWEYACRAGTTGPFAFGDNVTTDQVNYDGNFPYADGPKAEYHGRTAPVKSLPANRWGLYQMHGNVWEWCRDRYQQDLGREAVVDPEGPGSGQSRVVRGGSWFNDGRNARSACRSRNSLGGRLDVLGFRLALGQGARDGGAMGSGAGVAEQGTRAVARRRSVETPVRWIHEKNGARRMKPPFFAIPARDGSGPLGR